MLLSIVGVGRVVGILVSTVRKRIGLSTFKLSNLYLSVSTNERNVSRYVLSVEVRVRTFCL